MSPTQERIKNRRRLLRGWIEEGIYSLPQLLEMLNGRLDPQHQVTDRTVDSDIRHIRGELKAEGMLIQSSGGRYHVVPQPSGVVLAENEKRMIPLVQKLIEPFSIVPGIERFQKLLHDEFDVRSRDMSVVKNAVAFTSPLVHMNPRVQSLAMDLLNFMLQGEAVAFHYRQVPAEGKEDRMILAYPLQIREAMGRFYLVSAPVFPKPGHKEWRVHALDEIRDLRVHPAANYVAEDQKAITGFDYRTKVVGMNLEHIFHHSVGIWAEDVATQPQRVLRYFAGWSITHIKACPIHPSQTFIRTHAQVTLEHLAAGEGPQDVAQVSFLVHDTPELRFRFGAYREFSWSNHHGYRGPKVAYNWD
jgi:hypothetical protein